MRFLLTRLLGRTRFGFGFGFPQEIPRSFREKGIFAHQT